MKPTYPTNLIVVSLCLFALPGCDFGPATVGEDPATTTAASTGGMSTGPGYTSGASETDESGGSTMSGIGSSGSTSTGPDLGGGSTTGGPGLECDPLLQDCPDGDACYPDGKGFTCDGPAGPSQVGDQCTDQVDCTIGTYCDIGVCHPFCDATQPGSCNDPADFCDPWFPMGSAPPGLEDVGSCQAGPPPNSCDPLLQDCPAGDACYPSGNDFACFGGDGPAQNGDQCASDPDCAAGLWCDVDVCTEFCDVGGACSDPGASCNPWYQPGRAPPGLEDVGSCGVVSGSQCDPLLQDCPDGEGCYPGGGAFECDVAGPAQAGDVCGQGCAPGLLCDADTCISLCDTDDPGGCFDPNLTCVALYAPGTAPPGLETVGTCDS